LGNGLDLKSVQLLLGFFYLFIFSLFQGLQVSSIISQYSAIIHPTLWFECFHKR